MKRIFPVLIICLFTLSPAAQQPDFLIASLQDQVKTRNSITLTSDFFIASNAMTYGLAKTYFLNGFITDAMKNGVSKNLSNQNRLGGEFNTAFYFRHKPDSLFGRTDLSWFIGVKNINHLNSTFTRDLFEVYFRGNKNYAGKTAGFAEFNYLVLKYQQLQFGLSKSVKKDSGSFEFSAAVGFNIGQQFLHIQSPRATLFTAETGEYLDIDADIQIRQSDSLKKNPGSFNGYGFSTDLFFKADIKEKDFFFARISNLGFIRWNNRSAELKADSTFRFQGVDVSSLFNFADSVKPTITIDSSLVQPFLTHRKYNSYTLFLPAKIEVGYEKAIGDHGMKAGFGANYIMNANYFPEFYLNGDYEWKNNIVALRVSYGGYTTFGTGIFYQRRFRHGYVLMLGSNYINSLFNLDTSISQHVHVTVYRNF